MTPLNRDNISWYSGFSKKVGRAYLFSIFLSLIVMLIVIGTLVWSTWQSRHATLSAAQISLEYQARALGDKLWSHLNQLEHDLEKLHLA